MNKETNIWMLATIFLLGFILGFGAGKVTPGVGGQAVYDLGKPAGGAEQGTTAGTTGGAAAQQPKLQTAPVNSYANLQQSSDNAGHFTLGDQNAKVKIVEFSDFQCPFCYRYFMNTFPKIIKDYVATGKASYSYYNFPLNIHPQAPKAAEAALCASEQNKYWEYHDLLFSNQTLWSGNSEDTKVYQTLAQVLNLDTGKFSECLSSGKYTAMIQDDLAEGEQKQISGTPTVFINDQKIVGAQDYYNFKKVIEEELK